jgi:4a-hydroxytetrahydrobiopterin dehydratase
MQKPARKNSHKERIFSLPQNKIDFTYQKEHQDRAPKEQKKSLKKPEAPSLLAANKVRTSIKNLEGWQLTDDNKMIYREFILRDFMTAVDLIDHIALIAEDEKHHPDIHLTQFRNLRVGLTTHDVGGLSEKDFIVALKINTEYKDKPIQNPQSGKKNAQSKQKQGKSSVSGSRH